MRQFLVFVRAGRRSLHRRLIDEDPGRNWDCCVNAWDGVAPADAADADVAVFQDDGSINKFAAFQAHAAADGRASRYRHVLMLDDDLEFEGGDISRFFEHCMSDDLYVSQPAIAWGSHANHVVNIQNPACIVRRVNFVEVMAPCFSRAALDELMAPTFGLTRCTWGIDYAWSSLLRGRGCLSVVDAIPMNHTKPMDRSAGPFYEMLRSIGIDPDGELAGVHARYPAWGEMATLPDGHRYRWTLSNIENERLVAGMEAQKLQAHLRRGGTLVEPRTHDALRMMAPA